MSTLFAQNRRMHAHPDQVAHWTAWSASVPEPSLLVRDLFRAETTGEPSPSATVTVELDGAAADTAQRISRGDRDLLRLVTGAALAVVAARAVGRDRVAVVLPAPAGDELHRVLPLALTVTRETTFRDLLGAARTGWQAAVAHRAVPVWQVIGQTMASVGDFALSVDGDRTTDDARAAGCTLHFDVQLGTAPAVTVAYDPGLYAPDTARRLAGCFADVLAAVTARPDAALSALLDAGPADRQVVDAANGTAADVPEVLLHSYLERAAAAFPDRIAITDGTTTYGEFNARANRLARWLRGHGVRPGDVVGVCLPRSPDMLAAIYGVLKAGGAYLPIDPGLPRNRVDYLVQHSGVRVVLGDAASRDLVDAAAFVDLADIEQQARTAGLDSTDLDSVTGPGDLCYVIYTSGSTGRPKGVMIEHRAIVNRLLWMQRAFPLRSEDVILHKTPTTFDVSVWEIFWWSLAGAAVCTLPPGDEKEPARIAARVSAHRATVMHFVPSMLQAFLAYADAVGGLTELASLRRVFASGEALTTGQVLLFRQLVGAAHGTELINLYGPTEAAVDVTWYDTADVRADRPVPIGRPIANIALHVVSAAGTPAPVGVPGELHIAGVGLARGYLNAADLTAERFVLGPDGDRRYRTGDLARWLPDGTIEFLGRIDSQVKIRGYRIELSEIEHVAAGLPGVLDCAVAAPADKRGERALCAYVVPGPDFDEAALRQGLAAELPSYMVPQFVVPVAEIPVSHHGKRDLSRLPAPKPATDAATYEAPRTPAERTLARLWATALGVPDVGIHDNFFALGGDSITFIGVLAAAHRAGMNFTFQDLFAHPTVAGLAPQVTARAADPAPAPVEPFALVTPADRDLLPDDAVDAYPLSTLQAGLLFEMAKGADLVGLYHDVLTYRIADTVHVDGFRRAVAAVVRRHPIFRTAFHLTGFSRPLQVVHDDVPTPLTVHDLAALPEDEQEQRLDGFIDTELAEGFTAGRADLVRVHLHLLGERGYQYTLSYHDAALDGWSVHTIHRDIFQTYFTLLDRPGDQPADDPLQVGPRDIIELERAAIESPEQRDYWQHVLAGAAGTVVPRYAEHTGQGVVMHDVALGEGRSAHIQRVAHELRVPVKTVLLAAHVAVLAFLAGTDDILTGYEHSGRPEVPGGDQIAGLFLNTVPFRVRDTTGSWNELVRRVYEAERELLPHRRYPMAEMKRVAQTRESLFETVFNFTHFRVLKDLSRWGGFELVRNVGNAQTEFPLRAEFFQDALTDEVQLSLHYHADVYDTAQIDRISGYYVRALELLTTRTEDPCRARTLMGAAELALVDGGYAGAAFDLPDATFVDLVTERARRTPSAVALTHGPARLTYADLDAAANRVAALLAAAGAAAGSTVTVLLDRGVAWAVSVLGILKLGAVYLPQDPAHPLDRLVTVLRRSECGHVLTDAGRADALTAALRDRMSGGAPRILTVQDAETRSPSAPPGTAPGPADPAYLIFTSGSTGEPKGAVITHRGMLNHLYAKVVDLGLTADDRIAQVATQCFDISVWQLLCAWLVGGRTVVFDQSTVADVPRFLRTTADERITVLEVVPTYLDALLVEVDHRPVPLPDLRWNLLTGEALPPALTQRWFARYDVPIVNAYGPTEAADDVTHHVITAPVAADRVPIGRAVINTGLYVVGADDQLRPVGSLGEICVTGPGVGLGYVNDPDRTAAVFRPNTLDQRSLTLYRTGDIGRWLPGGVLDCVGRVDHQVKIRGFRIELTEIEAALTRLPEIDYAVVLVRERGNQQLLVAYYTAPAEQDLTQVRHQLDATLPVYMLPDSLVRVPDFPLTPNGKVDRKSLSALDFTTTAAHAEPEPPADRDEQDLRAVFAAALGLPEATVGVTDSFFDLGGHSIAAMTMAARSGGRFTLTDLLAHPTVRTLTRRIREQDARPRSLLVDLTRAVAGRVPGGAPTVVCIPFAGGSAVSYLPLARALRDTGAPVRLLGVELPGRTSTDVRRPVPVADLARDLAAEIADTVAGPVALLGHCAGTGPALSTARALQRLGRPVSHLYAVAKVLQSDDPDAHAGNDVASATTAEVLDWLVANTGFAGLAGLTHGERHDLADAFRHDSAEASRAFATALDPSEPPLDCPVTAIFATDDLLAGDHERNAAIWGRFGSDLRVHRYPDGGHYLQETRAGALAAQLTEDLA
ncbi:amino acid adenylation domain-containing protein [Krasilnikovia sp. MM14-A1259]|uniref:amino acid adenylation domain-containing protein n=1 Tax=Krasilnikovia sp. MM14-A1259 TaxID=3373539 RepID=UPI0038038A51